MITLDFSLQAKSKAELCSHPVKTIENLHPRKLALRVRNHHFTVRAVDCLSAENAVFRSDHFCWREADREEFIRFKEGIQTALYALYVLNIPDGECIVQRNSARDYSVYQVKPLESGAWGSEGYSLGPSTYGADVECLLQNRKTGAWVSASSLTTADGTIGCDDAIAVHGKKVVHPILELRPEPAVNARQLHAHLLGLYDKLERYLQANDLRALSAGFGRFSVGGHLHVGNQGLTFESVRKLDLFLAVPFALMESGDPRVRRQRFGRLGSVRANHFSGFEYRSLPSWYSLIPDLLPVLEWFCYISEHHEFFPALDLTSEILQSYYGHSVNGLRKVLGEIERIGRDYLPPDDFSDFAVPFFRLIHRKSSVI